jgi:hypothetical protein
MLATFQNRLLIQDSSYQSPRVMYSHGRRLNIKVYIDYIPKEKSPTGVDWQISMEGDKATIREVMSNITYEISSYFKQRSNKDFSHLNFINILDMAERPSIE